MHTEHTCPSPAHQHQPSRATATSYARIPLYTHNRTHRRLVGFLPRVSHILPNTQRFVHGSVPTYRACPTHASSCLIVSVQLPCPAAAALHGHGFEARGSAPPTAPLASDCGRSQAVLKQDRPRNARFAQRRRRAPECTRPAEVLPLASSGQALAAALSLVCCDVRCLAHYA